MPRKLSSEKLGYLAGEKLTYTLEESAFLMHGHRTLDRFRRAGMLKPIHLESRRVVFKKSEVRACQLAISNGDLPTETLPLPADTRKAHV